MKNNTKFKETHNTKATIISVIFLVILVAILINLFIYIYKAPITETGFFQNQMFKILTLSIITFLFAFIVASLVGSIVGILKSNLQISKEKNNIKKSNPYIYLRELPNTFGIGVTSLLFDSTIENYKDIVAIILDLCARGYLNLIKQNDKYIIKVLKDTDDGLLNNEKYILNLIINNEIKNINYQEWYNYCMQDGIDLGLYYHIETKIDTKPLLTQDIFKRRRKRHFLISIISALLVFILFLFNYPFLKSFLYAALWFIIIYMVLAVLFYLMNLFTIIKNAGKQTSDINYKNSLNNQLTKTKKGIEELHKLYSFKAFINDFGNFVDKKPEEVILWDRYLSYAQVFGLTKEIMNSGYQELINNSSFQIDNIDNIYLNNIEITRV